MWSARLVSALVFAAMAGLSLPSLAAPAPHPSSSEASTKSSKAKPVAKKKARRAAAATTAKTRAGDRAPSKQAAAKKIAAKVPPSRSVGSPSDGELENGVRLQSKPYLYLLEHHKTDRAWGMSSLVAVIERAAKRVERKYNGSVLGVGELSAKHGGDIHRHRSHESGRDADIAFYLVNSKGRPLPPREFTRVDSTLKANAAGGRFDLQRNWMLISELLGDPSAHVTHIFVSEAIRAELLDYARKSGASSALRRRAAFALMQPTGSLPHDDHFHVRIACPKGDSRCVETPNNAPQKTRVAKTKRSSPPRVASAAKDAKRKRSESAPKAIAKSKPARPAAVASSKSKPPALMHGTVASPDAAADAQEVKDFLDELGDLRITQ